MNIYTVRRNDDVGYDEYDSFIIIANSPEQAMDYYPRRHYESIYDYRAQLVDWSIDVNRSDRYDWPVVKSDLTVELIGTTDIINEIKIVCASFNAG